MTKREAKPGKGFRSAARPTHGRVAVPSNDVATLEAVLAARTGPLNTGQPDTTFELFAIEQLLKSYDLSDEEILDGQIGGGNDGGIDGIYTFLDGQLLQADSEIFEPAFQPTGIKRGVELLLYAVQAKTTASFGEAAYTNVQATFDRLLDLGLSDEDLRKLFSDRVIEEIGIFRAAYRIMASRHPTVILKFAYATKGSTAGMDAKVGVRAEILKRRLEELIYGSAAECPIIGARELLELNARQRPHTLQLIYQENVTSADSHVAIVRLDDYHRFVTDERGNLRSYIFDSNVRDYEGDVEVNREIRETLRDAASPEFWWLNNGVTVLCSAATLSGKTFSLDDVQVVNGLQTSMTIHDHLKAAAPDDPSKVKSILVRIIKTTDPATRDRVIRATNSQTSVSAASLRATDSVQRDLELFFSQHGWFYERRKNYYKNLGRSPERVVSIPFVAQSMMAMGLSEPNNSRARPSSLIKRQVDYDRLFDSSVGYDIFLFVASTQRHIDAFMRSSTAGANVQERTNLRFHLAMVLVCTALGFRVHHPSQLRPLLGTAPFDPVVMTSKLVELRSWLDEYRRANGGEADQIAKSKEFVDFVLAKALHTSTELSSSAPGSGSAAVPGEGRPVGSPDGLPEAISPSEG